ncbi:MAG: NADH-quinone oxidoreductase subunit NuoK [Asgard group archaeon]|jgi:NADH-quinone oxidoreductase subunit K|nr:NADH-quinone oxidoreductase subunit NuoK [Asgard group archaeon]
MFDQLHLLILGIILFCVGLYALLGKRNVIKILMGIEIMTIAVNVVFIALGANITNGTFTRFAQIFPLLSIAIGAAVLAVGLAIVINNYRHAKSVDSDEMATLKR